MTSIDDSELSREEQERINNDLMSHLLQTPDSIYLDLAMIKDLRLGALLTFLTRKEVADPPKAYAYILSKLGDYNSRKYQDLEYIFPDLGITNAKLESRLQDPVLASSILLHAPITSYVDEFWKEIALNAHTSAVEGKTSDLVVTVNTYPLQLNAQDIKFVGTYFSEFYQVTAKVIYQDPSSFSAEELLQFDQIITIYLKEMSDSESVRLALGKLKFLSKRIQTPRFFGYRFEPLRDAQKEELVVQATLGAACEFQYLSLPKINL